MQIEDCYYLGKVTKKHGFKGNLIFYFDTDETELYKNLESVFIEINGMPVPFFIENIQPHSKNKYLVKLEDVSAEEAEKLINKNLYLPLDQLPELSGTDFYYHEIIGFQVIDSKRGEIGVISAINDAGVQPLFEIRYQDRQILIPVVDDWILNVDRTQKQIEIKTPEGLINLYL